MRSKTKPLALDLFSGPGGLSLGLKRGGFVVAAAFDVDPHVRNVYTTNHKHTRFVSLDLSKVGAPDVLRAANLERRDVDLVTGCPPCQGFSSANHSRRNINDPRNHLVDHFFRLVLEIRPNAFLFENVMGLAWYNGGYLGRSAYFSRLRATYDIRIVSLDAADYGVPQHRRRLFIVGSRGKKNFTPPNPTHGRDLRFPHVTVRDAIIGDLPRLGPRRGLDLCDYSAPPQTPYQMLVRGHAKKVHNHITTMNSVKVRNRIAHIPVGGNWSDAPANFRGINIIYSSVYRRLSPHNPSVTIGHFRKNMLIHPCEDRLLSLREGARLQGFPDTYYFNGPIGHMQQQIADAAPPQLACALAKQLRKLFD